MKDTARTAEKQVRQALLRDVADNFYRLVRLTSQFCSFITGASCSKDAPNEILKGV
jgi:hypothetical protein